MRGLTTLLMPIRLAERLGAGAVIGVVRIYQRCLSPLLPPVCRFRPTCSEYMVEAVRKKGLLVGVAKGVWRILRCNPLFPGGYDPVR
ncbi:MAG: membrane protein insertion efficiency factor YidD [Candidatus Brocadiia bacterium]